MTEKQRKKSGEGFWSESNESEEDFETLLGISKVKNVPEEIELKEEETTTNVLNPTDNSKIIESKGMSLNNKSLISKVQTNNPQIPEKDENSYNKILPVEKMDFLWDDEEEEDVFTRSPSKVKEDYKDEEKKDKVKEEEKKEVKEEVKKDYKNKVKEEEKKDYKDGVKEEEKKEVKEDYKDNNNDVKEKCFLEDLKTLNTENFNLPTIEKEKTLFISNSITNNKETINDYKETINDFKETINDYKNVQHLKPEVKPYSSPGLSRSTHRNVSESKPTHKKFDFFSGKPRVHFLNKFVLTYCIIKQKRRNQQGEYIEKDVNVLNSYEYNLLSVFNSLEYNLFPVLNSSLTIDSICDEYKKIKEILTLKDAHVDSICDVIGVSNVSYSQYSYSEKYDSSDVNTVIDLALEDKEMAVDYACKKSMWSFALLCSNNRPDVVRQFLIKTCRSEMVELALSVFNHEESKDLNFYSDWTGYLKHILRLPFGEIHLKLIQKLYNEDKSSLYVLLVALHLLNIINIGNLIEYYPRNFHFMKILLFLDSKTPVKNLDLLLYQYITVLYDFDKSKAEEVYKTNKKRFNSKIQTSLDKKFNVASWGFGFKEVINFGISKILNVEELNIDKDNINIDKDNINIDKDKINIDKDKINIDKDNINIDKNKSNISTNKSNIPTNKGKINIDKNKNASNTFSVVDKNLNKTYANEFYESLKETPKQSTEQSTFEEKHGKVKIEDVDFENLAECSKIGHSDSTFMEESSINNVEHTFEIKTSPKSKSMTVSDKPLSSDKPLYSDKQHAKSFADIMDLEKPQKEFTTEDDTSLFLSKYNIDDDEAGLRKQKEEKKEENSSFFFSMFNFFKKSNYKVDIQASDDIKYDPVTKKWVSGNTQSIPQEAKITTPKSIPLPGKGKPKVSVDLQNMSLYANKKTTTNGSIPAFKKPTRQNKEDVKK